VQSCERIGQIPALERRRLIQSADLLLQQRQVMHWIEDHVRFLVRPGVPGDHLGAAANNDLVDIATDLHFVVSKGDRDGVVVASIPDHRD